MSGGGAEAVVAAARRGYGELHRCVGLPGTAWLRMKASHRVGVDFDVSFAGQHSVESAEHVCQLEGIEGAY